MKPGKAVLVGIKPIWAPGVLIELLFELRVPGGFSPSKTTWS